MAAEEAFAAGFDGDFGEFEPLPAEDARFGIFFLRGFSGTKGVAEGVEKGLGWWWAQRETRRARRWALRADSEEGVRPCCAVRAQCSL